ncbi:hypothetical protein [Ehrlichia chaffeensis]|uniref:hypothetical protein n=1 Tax=Ehrlichia chaffeensis TaxID=945 RepID=UPI0013052AF4|nr:hypothetical protein [Ehrlichia chaffeensis]
MEGRMFGEDRRQLEQYEGISRGDIQRKLYNSMLLKLDRQDLIRKKIVMVTSVLYFVVFVSFAVMQSGVLDLTQNQLTLFANFMDYLALFLCVTFLIAGLYNVLYLEREKRKVNEKLKRISQDQFDERVNPTSIKFANFCETHANKFDLAGTFCTTIMQAIAVFSLTLPAIFDVSKIPVDTAFNLQGIVDTVGNILFTIAAGMFLCSYMIKCNKNKNKDGKSTYSVAQSLVLTSLFFGTFLILAGKVLLSFETRGGAMYTGVLGPLGMDAFPMALIVRAVGMAIFCFGYGLMLYMSTQQHDKLSNEVRNGLPKGASVNSNMQDVEQICCETRHLLQDS